MTVAGKADSEDKSASSSGADGVALREKNRGYGMIPMRDVVVFPGMIMPIMVGREMSIRTIEENSAQNNPIFLVTQKTQEVETPEADDLYRVGVLSNVVQVLRLPDGSMKALVEPYRRARWTSLDVSGGSYRVEINELPETGVAEVTRQAARRLVLETFERYVGLSPMLPDKIVSVIQGIADPHHCLYAVAAHTFVAVGEKQALLEEDDFLKRSEKLIGLLKHEIGVLQVQHELDEKIRSKVRDSQKDFYLREQMNLIRQELGRAGSEDGETAELRKKIEQSDMTAEVRAVAMEELERVAQMSHGSPQLTISLNYLDWLIRLPWQKKSDDLFDLKKARRVLDGNHAGLDEVKNRIVEHLAVMKLNPRMKGPILCLVGPPGTGKTSLARSVAAAIGRNFVRKSLGGVRDEAEIRGHRRTYIGALPGRIVQGMKKAGTVNPVFLLDEIDKLSRDSHGDPSAALLEVLDPDENNAFSDHYLEVEYDLSRIMFICTANLAQGIPPVLRDRMEILNLTGYSELEKLNIARTFLVPEAVVEHGLDRRDFRLSDVVLKRLIRDYTREAGVRSLKRVISKVARHFARKLVASGVRAAITEKNIARILGPATYADSEVDAREGVGMATGMAYTETGGSVMNIEASFMPGKPRLLLTGQLGDVMRESARAALTYLRANAGLFGIPADFFENRELHLHVPDGATPKDGPSAGVAMFTAMASAAAGTRVNRMIAMTGEITLRGSVLPVGGIKEKVLAAHREGIRHVLLPAKNKNVLAKIPKEIGKDVKFTFLETAADAYRLVTDKARAGRTGGRAKKRVSPRRGKNRGRSGRRDS